MSDKNNKASSEEFYYSGKASFSPVPLHVGSALIKPEDKGKIKATALETMERQAQQQIAMLKRQADSIMKEVKEIEQRIQVSYGVYEADIKFTPQIGETYHLYIKESGKKILSMIGPKEWKKQHPYKEFIGSVKLLADKTWEQML